jgi:hypothetical protein
VAAPDPDLEIGPWAQALVEAAKEIVRQHVR